MARRALQPRVARAGALPAGGETEAEDPLAHLAAEHAGVVTETMRRDACSRVHAALDELSEQDREVLVLRSIEQVSLSTAARILGATENAVAVRHHRALRRLRERVPDSLFADLDDA